MLTAGHCRHIHAYELRHTHSNQEHEDIGNACCHIFLHLAVDMSGLHHNSKYEGRQQHLDVNAFVLTEIVFSHLVNALGEDYHKHGIDENGFPVLFHLVVVHLFPSENNQGDYHNQYRSHLPLHPYHRNLQRNHKQDGVKVVKYGKYLDFLVHPAGLEFECGQHSEKDSG